MKKIIITNESTMSAEGKLNSCKCKPILCIDTGKVYSSVTDAAAKEGVSISTISGSYTGKTKTANGKRFCLVSQMSEHYEEIARRMREMYPDYIAAEAKRREDACKAKEAERKAKAEKNYAKKLALANKALEELDKRKAELDAFEMTM